MKRLSVFVEEDLKKKVKIYACRQEKTLNAVVVEALEALPFNPFKKKDSEETEGSGLQERLKSYKKEELKSNENEH